MYRAGPAGNHQDELPGVISPLHGHDTERRSHVIVDELVNAVRCRNQVHGQGLRDVLVNGRARGPGVELQFTFLEPGRVQVTQYILRIGDGGQGAAAAVTGRPRYRTGAFRPDRKQSALVYPGNGPTAGADRMYVQDGRSDAVLPYHSLRGHGRFGVFHQRNVK